LPQESGDESLTDQIIGNTEYIGAASILLLLVILLIVKKRRNQLNEERELDGDTDFSSTMQSRMASVAAAAQSMSAAKSDHTFSETGKDDLTYENMNAYPETEEYDYGFDKDSIAGEEHIGQAKKSESETVFVSGLPPENETLADNSQSNDQSINLNLQEDFSENHSELADVNEDYDPKGSKDEITFNLTDEADEMSQTRGQSLSIDHEVKDRIELSDKPVNLQESINASDYELEMDFDDSKYSSASASPEDKALEKDNSIEFEFAHSDINLAEDEPANEVKLSNSILNDSIAPELTEEVLDFDQSQDSADNTKKLEVASHVPELGLADINLDIEDSNSIDKEDEVRGVNEKSEQWQEIETKLDLAKAYQEMEDKEGAKEMLEEVIRDGDTKQKKAARKLLKSL
jgi:pilus assembly protein FimV